MINIIRISRKADLLASVADDAGKADTPVSDIFIRFLRGMEIRQLRNRHPHASPDMRCTTYR
ncbi:MAG: hypothetical protein KFH87_02065 [Bacteroidetes bacterium]|nr:hypothetical protein [Bacteroidota bacterium]